MRLMLFVLFAGCLAVSAAFGAGDCGRAIPSRSELYLAPDGDDCGAGTLDAPFATLERARDAVRELKQDGLPAEGVTVRLRGGTYVVEDTFALLA